MPKVTVIPATRDFHTGNLKNDLRKKRVAAYARVSTNSEEQQTSYEAQVDYYTKYIKSRPDWEFVEVYTDEGITVVVGAKEVDIQTKHGLEGKNIPDEEWTQGFRFRESEDV